MPIADASNPTTADLFLAFRQAKHALATERGMVGRIDLAKFELNLDKELRKLKAAMKNGSWFDKIDIGRMVVLPKSTSKPSSSNTGVVRIGTTAPSAADVQLRLQLEPSVRFAIAEVVYLWEFGGALEALLDPDACVGYRLRRVASDGAMDRTEHGVYENWPTAFASYRDEPINAARAALKMGQSVLITSTDVISFFDSIEPSFLVDDAFIATLGAAARRLGRRFSKNDYRSATNSLLKKYSEFRAVQRAMLGTDVRPEAGVPIGALTSRVVANAALASLDQHILGLNGLVHYRRYVDDIVVVTLANPDIAPSREEALSQLFPGFSGANSESQFVVPATGAVFGLKPEKTRVHHLTGEPGIDFLAAVQHAFSAVTSERRALLGNVDKLTAEFEDIDLFADGVEHGSATPRLRDADRFTLRRYMATAYLRGLERCAQLLATEEARQLLVARTREILSILDGSALFEDFEFVVGLLRAGLLCGAREVVDQTNQWLDSRLGNRLASQIGALTWRGERLPRKRALDALDAYFVRRRHEAVSTACSWGEDNIVTGAAVRDARLLRQTDLRYLDSEDDFAQFGALGPAETNLAARDASIRRATRGDPVVVSRLAQARVLLERSRELAESVWDGVSDVALILFVQSPQYFDVARRFLATLESPLPAGGNVGQQINSCVDALRGTRYARRTSFMETKQGGGNSILTVRNNSASGDPRVILMNLLTSDDAFEMAAAGTPRLTRERLRLLDDLLREARKAAHAAKREKRPSLLVFPELSVPRRWVRTLCDYAVQEELSVVAGVEYHRTPNGVVNQAIGVFPAGRKTTGYAAWTKRHPAVEERSLLALWGTQFAAHPPEMQRLVVDTAHGRIGVLICSEILEADALARLCGQIELLAVPAWNTDTPSFDHVTHSVASLLVHCFVCVANNAKFSDSRIAAPINEPRHERDWCRLIHKNESRVVWGDLPVSELRAHHEKPPTPKPPSASTKERRFRPLPPGWRR